MHRVILGLIPEDKKEVDHGNRNTLDNRRRNLRGCTHRQNMMNRKKDVGATSRYKGVSWSKERKKWVSQITIGKKCKSLGRFAIEELAALAYDIAATYEYGEFANLNFPSA